MKPVYSITEYTTPTGHFVSRLQHHSTKRKNACKQQGMGNNVQRQNNTNLRVHI